MTGIYIHIPFCRQACRYCDFYFTVSLKYRDGFVESLIEELEQRPGVCDRMPVSSFYLGGGTPSVLTAKQLEEIVNKVHLLYGLEQDAECTLECNPEDVGEESLALWKRLGINRLSIGVQSFRKEDLVLMRRSHTALQAEKAVLAAEKAGFRNISVDLIYGIPGQGNEEWEENLEQCLSLPIVHLSAYHLSFEPGTVFDHWRKKKRIIPVEDAESVAFYRILREKTAARGFEHYEISNFALQGQGSRHNQLYWSGKPYQGFGPSAHSFLGKTRSWNPPSLKRYLEHDHRRKSFSEEEILSREEEYHDYLITSLRTSAGADPLVIRERFGVAIHEHFTRQSKAFLEEGQMKRAKDRILIDPDYWLMADSVLRKLFTD